MMPFAATWIQLEIIILNQTEKDKYILLISYLSNIKYDTNELIYEIEIESQAQRID